MGYCSNTSPWCRHHASQPSLSKPELTQQQNEQPWWICIKADKMSTWNQLNLFNTWKCIDSIWEYNLSVKGQYIYANIYLTEISTFITGQSLKFQSIITLTLPYSLRTLTATPPQTCLQALALHPQCPRQEANAKNKPQKVHSNVLFVFVKAHQTWVVTANQKYV